MDGFYQAEFIFWQLCNCLNSNIFGISCYYLSEVFIDGLLLQYYQKLLQLYSAEKLIDEIDKLPISLPLKI
ncbi:hypothetical protein [Hydrocoleum sp. CS-953]|uniref:hypothetical protein n=1 Tax=Hydrocoleum sp. CS-953 TaxID=1671698 RepID=UPI00117B2B81|nr:hypothetical protein [Hydrocoleum sp. CS-953]